MAQYNLERTGRSGRVSRRVEIKKGGFTFHPLAFILAILVAFLVWLYMEGQNMRQDIATSETETTAAVEVSAPSFAIASEFCEERAV